MYENTKPEYISYLSVASILDSKEKVAEMLKFVFDELYTIIMVNISKDDDRIIPLAFNHEIDIIHVHYKTFIELFTKWAVTKFDDYEKTAKARISLDYKIGTKKTEYSAPLFLLVFLLEMSYKITKMNSFYMKHGGRFNFSFYYPTVLKTQNTGALIEISAIGFSRSSLEDYIDMDKTTEMIILLSKINNVVSIGKKKTIDTWVKSGKMRKLYS